MNRRVVVVTGASRGAGKGIALALGATALLEAAPFACAVTHGDPTRRLDPVGPGPGGFARFRLHL